MHIGLKKTTRLFRVTLKIINVCSETLKILSAQSKKTNWVWTNVFVFILKIFLFIVLYYF